MNVKICAFASVDSVINVHIVWLTVTAAYICLQSVQWIHQVKPWQSVHSRLSSVV